MKKSAVFDAHFKGTLKSTSTKNERYYYDGRLAPFGVVDRAEAEPERKVYEEVVVAAAVVRFRRVEPENCASREASQMRVDCY